jgi:hypothetical protein
MSPNTVDEADLEVGKVAVLNLLNRGAPRPLGDRQQALAGGFEIILLQVLIPIFVGMTSTVLAEVLKGKFLGSLSRKQAQATLDELKSKPLVPRAELDSGSMKELCRLLGPYGVNDSAVKAFYSEALRDINRRKGL